MSKLYTIQVSEEQLRIIHESLELHCQIQNEDPTYTQPEHAMLAALVAVSNPKSAYPPKPTTSHNVSRHVNIWARM